jgi:hypothetical protein
LASIPAYNTSTFVTGLATRAHQNKIHYPTKTIIAMKNAIKFFAAIALIAIALSSCSSVKGTGYQSHLKNKHNKCVNSDFGCGWANTRP